MNQPSGKTAVIYARYSSAMQRDASIEQQVNACMSFAASQDLKVLRVYDDHAMTGTNDNRPQFRQMIKDSASRAFDYVIVYTLDRFSRDRYDSAIHKHTLRENGVRVLSATEHISDDPTGALMESVLEGFAEYYSKELAQKIRRGLTDNANKCMVNGIPGYGHKKGADGKFEIAPEEAAILNEVFLRIDNGESLAEIIRDLNARGVPNKRGRPWTRTSFNKILHNKRLIGYYIFGDICIENGVPAILDPALFYRVQERTMQNCAPIRKRRENSVYLLTGKLFCGHCKSPMIGVSGVGRHGDQHFYYVCKGRRDGNGCSKKNVTRDFVEKLVTRKIAELLSQPEIVDWLADKLMQYLKENEVTDEMRLLQDQLEQKRKERDNILRMIRLSPNAPASVLDLLRETEADAALLESKLIIATDRAKPNIDKAHVCAWMEELAAGNIDDKKYQERIIDAFLVRAYLYDDRIKVIFNIKGQNEYEIPFDIDDIEAGGVSINASCLHQSDVIRTPIFIAGLFVIVDSLRENVT